MRTTKKKSSVIWSKKYFVQTSSGNFFCSSLDVAGYLDINCFYSLVSSIHNFVCNLTLLLKIR